MAKAPVPPGQTARATTLVMQDDDAEAVRATEFLGGNEQGAPSAGKDAEIAALQAQIAKLQGPTDLKLEVAGGPAATIGAGDVLLSTKPVGMPKTVRIVLEETDNMAPTGQTFALNGKAYLIRPGEPVDVPVGILEVIDNAVMSVPIHDPQTLKVIGYRNRHRFPYRRLNAAA